MLKDKPPLWGQVTNFGRYEKFLTEGMLAKPCQRSKGVVKHLEDIEMGTLDEVDMEISEEDDC